MTDLLTLDLASQDDDLLVPFSREPPQLVDTNNTVQQQQQQQQQQSSKSNRKNKSSLSSSSSSWFGSFRNNNNNNNNDDNTDAPPKSRKVTTFAFPNAPREIADTFEEPIQMEGGSTIREDGKSLMSPPDLLDFGDGTASASHPASQQQQQQQQQQQRNVSSSNKKENDNEEEEEDEEEESDDEEEHEPVVPHNRFGERNYQGDEYKPKPFKAEGFGSSPPPSAEDSGASSKTRRIIGGFFKRNFSRRSMSEAERERRSLRTMKVSTEANKDEKTLAEQLTSVAKVVFVPELYADQEFREENLGQYQAIRPEDPMHLTPAQKKEVAEIKARGDRYQNKPGQRQQQLTARAVPAEEKIIQMRKRIVQLEKEVKCATLEASSWRLRAGELEKELKRYRGGGRHDSDDDSSAVPITDDDGEDDGIEEGYGNNNNNNNNMRHLSLDEQREDNLLDLTREAKTGPVTEGAVTEIKDSTNLINLPLEAPTVVELNLLDLGDEKGDSGEGSPDASAAERKDAKAGTEDGKQADPTLPPEPTEAPPPVPEPKKPVFDPLEPSSRNASAEATSMLLKLGTEPVAVPNAENGNNNDNDDSDDNDDGLLVGFGRRPEAANNEEEEEEEDGVLVEQPPVDDGTPQVLVTKSLKSTSYAGPIFDDEVEQPNTYYGNNDNYSNDQILLDHDENGNVVMGGLEHSDIDDTANRMGAMGESNDFGLTSMALPGGVGAGHNGGMFYDADAAAEDPAAQVVTEYEYPEGEVPMEDTAPEEEEPQVADGEGFGSPMAGADLTTLPGGASSEVLFYDIGTANDNDEGLLGQGALSLQDKDDDEDGDQHKEEQDEVVQTEQLQTPVDTDVAAPEIPSEEPPELPSEAPPAPPTEDLPDEPTQTIVADTNEDEPTEQTTEEPTIEQPSEETTEEPSSKGQAPTEEVNVPQEPAVEPKAETKVEAVNASEAKGGAAMDDESNEQPAVTTDSEESNDEARKDEEPVEAPTKEKDEMDEKVAVEPSKEPTETEMADLD